MTLQLFIDAVEDVFAIHDVAALSGMPSFFGLFTDRVLAKGKDLVTLFKKAKGFANNLAGGVVAPGFDTTLHKLFELWGEMYVHGAPPWNVSPENSLDGQRNSED